jgi:beta-lactamase class D
MKSRHIAIVLLTVPLAAAPLQAKEICTVIADAATGQTVVQRGDCTRRVTPASTFKIAISLMGYDAGFLKDEHTPLLPYRKGDVDWRAEWLQPADPTRWMQESVVWYSQRVTAALGQARFADTTRRFDYGNMDVSGLRAQDGLALPWINAALQISPLEQVRFLAKMVNRTLGVSPQAYDMTARIVQPAPVGGGWHMQGKTGAAAGLGWYVGWATRDARTLVFARLVASDDTQPQDVSTGIWARDAFVPAFPGLVATPPPD